MDEETRWAVDAIRRRYRRPTTGKPLRQSIAELLAQLQVGNQQGREALREAWRTAAGDTIADHSVPTRTRNRILEVIVADSMVSQEVALHKSQIIEELRSLMPDEPIRGIRCKLGRLGD